MSFWVTKSSGRDKEYIVLRHTLRGVNYVMNGIKFRDGYAVVEKDSKIYKDLKKIPVLRAAKEYPLIWLRELPFITRPLDVKSIYGADIYVQYTKQLDKTLVQEAQDKKVEEEIKHIEEHKKCSFRTEQSKELCSFDSLEESPSGYCIRHILHEPKLAELGIEIPRFIEKKEKPKYREKVINQLAKLKKDGKF